MRVRAMSLGRRILSVLIVAHLSLPAVSSQAQQARLVPDPAADQTPRAQLERSLTALAHRQLLARKDAMARVTTPDALEARRVSVRETFLRLIGGLPSTKAPLQARVTGQRKGDGFAVENVVYESLPGYPVTANVYVPAGSTGRLPAIVVSMGHYDLGKAGERVGPDLARKGFVVLAYDPMGQGERLQHYDPELRASRAGGSTEEHGQAAARAELVGESVARYFVWDAMRGLDYLSTREDVDPARLGAAGCSGGGTVTTYLAALDLRVKAAAVACYITSWDAIVDGPGPQEAEQSLFGFLSSGLDMGDYVALIAPRPLLILSTADDFFPVAGARAVFEEGKGLYALAGAADRIDWSSTPGGHGISPPGREAMAAFFQKWLAGGKGDARDEPDARLAPADLQVTETGQVSTSLHARTIADLVAEHAPPRAALASTPAEAEHQKERVQEAVAEMTGAPRGPGANTPPRTRVHSSLGRPGYRIDLISFPVEEGLDLWGLLAVPEGKGRRPAVLLADPRLRAATAEAPGADLDDLARRGHVVLALELRGNPTAADPPSRPSLLGPLAATYRRASVVGKSLAGMRAADVRRGVDLLAARGDVDALRIDAIGRGTFAMPVLLAAVLDPRVARVALVESPVSYRAVLGHSIHKDLPESLLPGVLLRFDVGDLVLALAPRPVALVDPVDPVGQALGRAEADRELGDVLAADRALAGADRIRIVRRARGAAFRWE
jgi:dienelactone hydrolase